MAYQVTKTKTNVQKQTADCWLDVLDSLHTTPTVRMSSVETQSPHKPVMLEQVLQILDSRPGDRYLDLTAGYGGHARAVLSLSQNKQQAVLVDRDGHAIDYLKKRFKGQGVNLMHSDMLSALHLLQTDHTLFDMVLIDAGVSSPQFDQNSRGFSLQSSGPLDMRMDQSAQLSAEQIVNTWSEEKLATIIFQHGEERQARAIAGAIVEQRPLNTTEELANLVSRVVRRKSKIHPATKTFQAIRIAVNDELSQLEQALPRVLRVLAPGGRVVVISFHSLEDRIVKNFFRSEVERGLEAQLRLLTKHPLTADHYEYNPRARSAKLRAAVKLKQTQRKELINAY